MRRKVNPYHAALRLAIGKEIKVAREKKGMSLRELGALMKWPISTAKNIENGKASLDKAMQAVKYFKIDFETIALDLRVQMKVESSDGIILTGDDVKTAYYVGTKRFEITGKIARAINPYANVKIIEIVNDDGLNDLLPGVHRVAVHKEKVSSVG